MKVFVMVIFTVLVFIGTSILIGCDEGMQVMKPAMKADGKKLAKDTDKTDDQPTVAISDAKDSDDSETSEDLMDSEETMGIQSDLEESEAMVLEEPPSEPIEQEPSPWEKSREIIRRLHIRTVNAYINAEEGYDFLTALTEEAGFFFDNILLEIINYEENMAEVERLNNSDEPVLFTGLDLIAEYLRLAFKHPSKTEDELMNLFRTSARKGNLTINAEEVAKKFRIDFDYVGYDFLPDIENYE